MLTDIATADPHPLQAYRKEHGLTRAELARKLEVTRMAIWRYETRTRLIDRELLTRFSERTGLSKSLLRPDLAELMADVAEAAE
jgi:transcriptional regulator with XRE-family HTH domain